MKRFLTTLFAISGFVFLFLILTSASPAIVLAQDGPPGDSKSDAPSVRIQTNGTSTSPIPGDDQHFTDDGTGELHQYLYGSEGDGYIRFNIPITRYYFGSNLAKAKFDGNGFLAPSVINDAVSRGILPATATLRMRVWDVDEEPSVCPEVDNIYVNGIAISQSNFKSTLSGANVTWSTPSYLIPISALKFPQSPGTNGNKPVMNNEIAIKIDVNGCTTWAVEVDWGMLTILTANSVRPVVLAYGWTGDLTTFGQFKQWLDQDDIPYVDVDLKRGIYKTDETAKWLGDAITTLADNYGINKVDVFAHSKGGIVIRKALQDQDNEVEKHVVNVITFASPHHGSFETNDPNIDDAVCKGKKFSGADKDLCVTAMQEFGTERMRIFNYSDKCVQAHWWSGWTGCTPNYYKSPNVNYYSFADKFEEWVLPLQTMTFPWKAQGEVPFPTNIHVDQQFWDDHSTILHDNNVYKCALHYLYSSLSAATCPTTPTNTSPSQPNTTTASVSNEDYQFILNESGSLLADGTQTVNASVDSGTTAVFKVYSDTPLDYTLIDPNGRTINPTVADADPDITYTSTMDGSMSIQQYQVTAPPTGTWQNVVHASAATDYFVSNAVTSTVQLKYATDQTAYKPGDTITLEAALANDMTPYTDVVFTGSVTYPDSTTDGLAFYDDGSHGDTTPADGTYTAQLTAPAVSGYATIAMNATKDSIVRIANTSVAISAQTAQFQQVTNETPVDTNGNSLYDALNFDVAVNVITSGQFEFQATLMDASNQPVGTGYYSTLMAGVANLPTGVQTIPLSFDGSEIYKHGVNGPYTLTNLVITDVTNSALHVDTQQNVHTTAAYPFSQFEHPAIAFKSDSETPVDNNGNGRYDLLQINLNVDITQPGTYNINGRLVDQQGEEIAWASTNFSAPAAGSYIVQLAVDGNAIGAHRVNGPYILQDISIFNTTGPGGTVFENTYTTQAYSFVNFEGVVNSVFGSLATRDGWMLESSETSNSGGTINATSTTFNLGDNATKKQYRGILSFNTSAIPDTAVITGVTLKVKQQGIVGGGNPLTIFQGFMVDIKSGFFGTTTSLQAADFQAAASKTYGPFRPVLLPSGFYSINLTSGKAYINKLASKGGVTQIRLRFKLDDNNNALANYLSLYSGNASNGLDRPQLVVTYTVP